MAEAKIKEQNYDKFEKSYMENFFMSKVFKINLKTDLFANISFPNLPYNFKMMMSNIDYPSKAKKNPNGTLYMTPQDIDANSADDIAMQCFGGDKFGGDKSGLKMTNNPEAYAHKKERDEDDENSEANEAFYLAKKYLKLFEDSINGKGADIKVQDVKDINSRAVSMNVDIVKAIADYVTRSVTAIQPLVQMAAGDNASSAIQKVAKVIQTANAVSNKTVKDWLKAQSNVEKDKGDNKVYQQLKDLEKEKDCSQKASYLANCLSISKLPSGIDRDKFISQVSEESLTVDTERRLRKFILRFTTFGSVSILNKMIDKNGTKPVAIQPNAIKASGFRQTKQNENLKYKSNGKVNEDWFDSYDDDDDDDDRRSFRAKTVDTDDTVDYDKIYQDFYSTISAAMSEAIGPRESWRVMKEVANQMKYLKDQADETIKERIKIVCKTNGQKSIFTHPKVANGLENMWSRYSAELQNRIDNRIGQLTGTNGSKESGSASMVEDFLRNTYPQIIAALLTYRCIFEQLAVQYNNGYITNYSLDDRKQIAENISDKITSHLMVVVGTYDALNSQNNPQNNG